MKKTWKLAALILCMAMVLGACGQSGQKTGKDLPDYMTFDYDYKDYFELGEYKGVSYTPFSTEVTEEEVKEQLAAYQEQMKTVEKVDKKVIENGDVVHIVFTGYLDGKAFEGGASGEEGTDLEIGSGSFVGTFETQLIGKEVGQDVTLEDVVFPDKYLLNPDLAGKSATFEVSIQSIGKYVVPELDDAFAASLELTDVSTMEQLKNYISTSLKSSKESQKESKDYQAVLEAVLKNSKIKGYPESAVASYKDQLISTYQSYATMYGMEFSVFLAYMMGMDQETFEKQAEEAARQNVANQMLLTAVIEAEGMDLSEEEYQTGLERYAEENQSTVDDLKKNYEETQLKQSVLMDKAIDFLMDGAKAAE